jgi:hypothetical protein
MAAGCYGIGSPACPQKHRRQRKLGGEPTVRCTHATATLIIKGKVDELTELISLSDKEIISVKYPG